MQWSSIKAITNEKSSLQKKFASCSSHTTHCCFKEVIKTENNSVSTSLHPDEIEKEINEIYLSTIAVGIYTFTEIQASVINTLAYECPYTGGTAVFKARSLKTFMDMNITIFNDDDCLNQMGSRHSNFANNTSSNNELGVLNSKNNVYVIPNPANDRVSFVFNNTSLNQNKVDISLFDISGRRIFYKDENLTNNKVEIDLGLIAPGTYSYKIQTELGNFTGRIVIIR